MKIPPSVLGGGLVPTQGLLIEINPYTSLCMPFRRCMTATHVPHVAPFRVCFGRSPQHLSCIWGVPCLSPPGQWTESTTRALAVLCMWLPHVPSLAVFPILPRPITIVTNCCCYLLILLIKVKHNFDLLFLLFDVFFGVLFLDLFFIHPSPKLHHFFCRRIFCCLFTLCLPSFQGSKAYEIFCMISQP